MLGHGAGRRRRRHRVDEHGADGRQQGVAQSRRSSTATRTSISAPGSSPRTTRASPASRARRRTRSRCAATSAPSPRSRRAASRTRSCRSRCSDRRRHAERRQARDRGSSRSTPTRGRAATRRSRRSAKLRPAFHVTGTVTAGNSSQTSDGAAAVVVTSASWRRRAALTPLARFVAYATAGVPPELFGIGPVPAIRKVLKLAGLTLDQIDLDRAQRGVRRAGAGLPEGAAHRSRAGSTSTAAPSRSAIRSAAPAPS